MIRNSILKCLICLVCLPAGLRCMPFEEKKPGSYDGKFIARGTNEIAKALLQEYVNDNGDNAVYSPLGTSALLAVFSEGARGSTREEIATALHFPKDVEVVRKSYKNLLERFLENSPNSPEVKTLFYVLKKYTVHEELLNILKEYYLTEVTYIDEPVERIKQVYDAPNGKETQQQKTQAEDVTAQSAAIQQTTIQPHDKSESNSDSVHSSVNRDYLPTEETLPVRETKNPTQKTQNTVQNIKITEGELIKTETDSQHALSSSKTTTEKSVQTAQESSRPTQKKAMKEPETSKTTQIKSTGNVSDLKATQDQLVTEKNTAEKVTAPEQKPAMKEKNTEVSKLKEKTPIKVTAVMGTPPKEHLSGMTEAAVKVKGETESHIIIFNGMKYDGEWETPFIKKPAASSGVFYKSEEEKVIVSTIQSEGYYNTSAIDDLDCQAIELPYKGGKYSLLILLPNARNGLSKLISALSEYPLAKIYPQLTESFIEVTLPTFQINTISKPVSLLKKVGGVQSVKSIFDPELADFSGISATGSNMYLSEVFQLITFKVDAQYTKTNFLTASIGYSRSNVPNFLANRPFLFFLRDKSEDLTIVNGKVLDPTLSPCFS